MQRVIFSWSGGKDSALALYQLQQENEVDIVALLSTVTEEYDRISMHGVRRALLKSQVAALGYPLEVMSIPSECTSEDYEQRMGTAMNLFAQQGVTAAVFGDLFLEDIRSYREERLARIGLRALFPVWGRDTEELAEEFIAMGFKAILVCVDTTQLPGHFASRDYDQRLLADLPAGVDPCGENGEFHTFVYDGPIFDQPLKIRRGEVVFKDDRFMFCDLLFDEGLNG